jgi:hypothetical protein
MPEKKSRVRKVTAAVPDASAAAVKPADEQVVQSVTKSLGLTGEPTQGEGKEVGPEATAAEPEGTPTGRKSASRMLTRSIVGKKPAAARGESQRVADAAKPSQKPTTGGGRQGPRRGASKGR